MTKKLEELFDLPTDTASPDAQSAGADSHAEKTMPIMPETLAAIDKIEAALPAVRGLEASDSEMDELADKAKQSFDDLMDLGMNVDSRFASEIFAVAGTMLGHAITAKTAKLNKKLRMIDLQMKKLKMDRDNPDGDAALPTAHAHVLDRNELLGRLLSKDSADTPKDTKR